MDDSDTELYKWWDNVDRKETFKDILKRVWKGGDFASDEERIVEALHIISYLYNVVDSKGEDEQDILNLLYVSFKINQKNLRILTRFM